MSYKKDFPNSRTLSAMQQRQDDKRQVSSNYDVLRSEQRRCRSVVDNDFDSLNQPAKRKALKAYFERINLDGQSEVYKPGAMAMGMCLSRWIDGAIQEYKVSIKNVPTDAKVSAKITAEAEALFLEMNTQTKLEKTDPKPKTSKASKNRVSRVVDVTDKYKNKPLTFNYPVTCEGSVERSFTARRLRLIQGVGIINTENLCWLNSALQLLFSIPEVVDFFWKNKAERDRLNQTQPVGDDHFAPVLDQLFDFNKLIQAGKCTTYVQSVHLLFEKFIQKMDPGRPFKDVAEGIDSIFENLEKESMPTHRFMDRLFGFQLQNKVFTAGTNQLRNGEQGDVGGFMMLRLQIQQANASIDDCLSVYLAPDRPIETDTNNPNDVAKNEQFSLLSYPQYLLLQLIRYDARTGSFNTKPIFFEEQLQFHGAWNSELPAAKYELIGVSEYIGSTSHYVTYLKSPENYWMQTNDNICRRIAFNEVQAKLGYVFLYRKCEEDVSFVKSSGLLNGAAQSDPNVIPTHTYIPAGFKKKQKVPDLKKRPNNKSPATFSSVSRRSPRSSSKKRLPAEQRYKDLSGDLDDKLKLDMISVQRFFGLPLHTPQSELKQSIDECIQIVTGHDKELVEVLRKHRRMLDNVPEYNSFLLRLARFRKDIQTMRQFLGKNQLEPLPTSEIREKRTSLHDQLIVLEAYSSWSKEQKLCFLRFGFHSGHLLYMGIQDGQRLQNHTSENEAGQELDQRQQWAEEFERTVQAKYPECWQVSDIALDYLVGMMSAYYVKCYEQALAPLITHQLEQSDDPESYEQVLQLINIGHMLVYPFASYEDLNQKVLTDSDYQSIIHMQSFEKCAPFAGSYTQPQPFGLSQDQTLANRIRTRAKNKDSVSDQSAPKYVAMKTPFSSDCSEKVLVFPVPKKAAIMAKTFYFYAPSVMQKHSGGFLRTSENAAFDPPERAKQLHDFILDYLETNKGLSHRISAIKSSEKLVRHQNVSEDAFDAILHSVHFGEYLELLESFREHGIGEEPLPADHFELSVVDDTIADHAYTTFHTILEAINLLVEKSTKRCSFSYAFVNCRPGGSKALTSKASENHFLNHVVLAAEYAGEISANTVIVDLSRDRAAAIETMIDSHEDISLLDFCFGPGSADDREVFGVNGYIKKPKNGTRMRIRSDTTINNEEFVIVFQQALTGVLKIVQPNFIMVSSDFDFLQGTRMTPYVFYLISQSFVHLAQRGDKKGKIPVLWLFDQGTNGTRNAQCAKAILEGFASVPYRRPTLNQLDKPVSFDRLEPKNRDVLRKIEEQLWVKEAMFTAPDRARIIVLDGIDSDLEKLLYYLQYNQLPNMKKPSDQSSFMLIYHFVRKHKAHNEPYFSLKSSWQKQQDLLEAYFDFDVVRPQFELCDSKNKRLSNCTAPISIIIHQTFKSVVIVVKPKPSQDHRSRTQGSEDSSDSKIAHVEDKTDSEDQEEVKGQNPAPKGSHSSVSQKDKKNPAPKGDQSSVSQKDKKNSAPNGGQQSASQNPKKKGGQSQVSQKDKKNSAPKGGQQSASQKGKKKGSQNPKK